MSSRVGFDFTEHINTIKTVRASVVEFTDDRKQEPFYVTLLYLDKEE